MQTAKKKIVIVDDEEDLCFLLSKMLAVQGHKVKCFHTLKSGLAGIGELKPDWVILDNDLPDGRGWENTGVILNSNPSINIIKISANPDSPRGHHKPNVHYLIKPLNINSITELIR